MGLLLLVAVGAVFGWLASIATQAPEHPPDLVLVASGAISATLAGLAVYDGSAVTGLSPQAFVAAALACAIVLACVVAIRRAASDQDDNASRD